MGEGLLPAYGAPGVQSGGSTPSDDSLRECQAVPGAAQSSVARARKGSHQLWLLAAPRDAETRGLDGESQANL